VSRFARGAVGRYGTRRFPPPPADERHVADIFTEVDEDLRRDRAERLWKAYGKYVMAAAVAIVVATAGWTWWTDHQRKQAAAEGERFFSAASRLAGTDPKQAIGAFEALGREGKSGFRIVALMHEAGLKARNDDLSGALAMYRAVANDAAADPDLRDAAALLGALVSVETLPPAEIDAMLSRLTTSTSPWRFSAFEVSAVAALRGGNAARARELYARIADDAAAPGSSRTRAAEMIQALGG
jgi:hypothetical protein